ncbi:mucoidy inhibitor MuiA family protein, partial [Lishizhenia sp.]|uniref:mucoidy inhibitor MuiA family protein n=1 Tax=Lishizhenia sp. TaxID=2497594 RepID=UPI00299DA4D8
MRKLNTLLLLTCISLSTFAQEKVLEVKTTISDVKLYLTAGEITRNTQLDLAQGRNKIVFKGISAYADPSSLQFSGDKDFTIVSTNTEMDFFTVENLNERLNELKDSLQLFQRANDKINNKQQGINAEIEVLKKNNYFGNSTERISIEDLGKTADFYRERLEKANNALSELNYQRTENLLEINRIRRELTDITFKENERSNQVIILIDVPQKTQLNATLRYMVSDCGWAATYDLIAQDVNQPIDFFYKAQVYNNTGNDWKNINLILTTNDPNLDASLPVLKTWQVNQSLVQRQNVDNRFGYMAPTSSTRFENRSKAKMNISNMNQRAYDTYVLGRADAANQGVVVNGSYGYGNNAGPAQEMVTQTTKQNVPLKSINISQIAVDFPIAYPFSVPSDMKPYTVLIKKHELNANFSHMAVPKVAKEAYLLANIAGWQKLDLIPGSTQIYFGGNYIGSSYLSTENTSDTLKLSFGRDAEV